MPIDTNLLKYCQTERQAEVINAIISEGTNAGAAKKLNINIRNIEAARARVTEYAARRGYAPNHFEKGVAPGYQMQKVTIQRNADGDIERSWERQTPEEKQQADSIQNVLENFQFKHPPKKTPTPKHTNKDLLNCYIFSDYHLGMYAWSEETADDWDTSIASKTIINALHDQMARSPNAGTGMLCLLGDFLHWDGLLALTPTSKHVLDADTRFSRLIELAIDLTSFCIETLLEKHKRLCVVICEGNHDEAGSAWLRLAIKKVYEKHKRVTVDNTHFPYYAYLHGETMIAFHHGHKSNMQSLPALFSSEPRYRSMWGSAKQAYIHTGHYHHKEKITDEYRGAIVERHPTLAGRDAYAARGGYVSKRSTPVITYHKTLGEIARADVMPR